MKNVLILGTGRAGKTTLAKMIFTLEQPTDLLTKMSLK